MTDKSTNRVFEQPGDGDMPKQFKVNINGQTFSFTPQGENVVVQTPFGVVKVSIASNENLGDLNNELAKLFASGGLTAEKLHEMVMSMPPIQQLLAQAPQLQDMMKQAFAAMAAKVETPAPAQPKKTLQKTPAIKNPFKPEGLTFERFYKMQSPN